MNFLVDSVQCLRDLYISAASELYKLSVVSYAVEAMDPGSSMVSQLFPNLGVGVGENYLHVNREQ